MELIIPAIKTAAGICGRQKLQEGQSCRLSRHCVSLMTEEGTLFYHVLTGALVLMPGQEITENDRRVLTENWFYVPEDFHEEQFADEVRRIAGMMPPPAKHRTSFTVLPTTDCNARCFYCYEIGIRRFSMSPETAHDTAEYIRKASGGEAVRIRWFGGEPLYNREAIDIICTELGRGGTEYESGMVSTGYYMDEETVKKAVQLWHLKEIQITVDGTEKIYNRTKAYIDADANPFERVMKHIGLLLAARVGVTVRLNMDARNADDLLVLAEDISRRFAGCPNARAYVALLHDFTGKIHRFDTQKEILMKYRATCDKLKEHGMLRQKKLPRQIRLNCCMADDDASETILPDGRIGRCEHYSETMITGDIRSGERNEAVAQQWKERFSSPECAECALYPTCNRLKMCEWNRDGCTEADREIRMAELKEQMLDALREYRERKGEEK